MFEITATTRLRRSPYFKSTVAEGVTGFQPYNQMLMPTGYGDPEGEYWRLINGVSMWDVAVERQVELSGKDAAELAQILSPRDLSKIVPEQGKYVALCNHAGTIINDPILLKLDDKRFWLSIADSNILFWARAIAAERHLDVEITEPDVSPLAVQGPLADNVVSAMFGDWVRDLKYFWFRQTTIEGIPLAVARSGWSKQGGYELYLMDGSKGDALWKLVREAGKPWDIGPGNPNSTERMESGLLSWGGDTDDQTNPFEVRMEKFVDLNVPDNVVGIEALRAISREGPKRHQLGIIVDKEPLKGPHGIWYDISKDGEKVGDMTCGIWSRRMEKNIGFALISRRYIPGDKVELVADGEKFPAELVELPFI